MAKSFAIKKLHGKVDDPERKPKDEYMARKRLSAEPIDLSIIVTIFNEQETIWPLYEEIVAALTGIRWELIIVDDGSTDESYQIESELYEKDERVSVIRLRRNFGKTTALSAGISLSRGAIVATIDGDLQDDPREIPRMLEALDSGLDFVIGWRRSRKDSLSKRVSSWLFNNTVSLLTGVHLHDMNCGLKLFRAEIAKELKLYGELHRFVPVLASQKGYRVGEMVVNHRPRMHGHSKYGFKRAFSALLDIQIVLFLTRYMGSPLRLFGSFGLVLLASGVLAGTHLSLLRFQGQHIGTRPLLFLAVLLVLSGFQLISTGLIGEMIRNISFDRQADYSVKTILHRDEKE